MNNFIYLMNRKPSELYKLYADDAELNWNFDGRRIELKTNETIRKFLSDAAPQRQFGAVDCKVQSVVTLSSSLLTVYGICDALDCKPRIFVQTFLLRRPDLLILNDALTVLLLCVPESDISKKPQRHISNNRCGVCNNEWHSSDPKSWVQCSNCLTWLHIECDPVCCDDVEVLILEKLNYLCPFCMSQFQSILAVQHTSTGNFSEPIPVSCLAKHGVYMPEKNKVLCHCNDCSEEAKLRSMTAWERHCGSDKKKWKSSVYLKGTNDLLFDFLNKNPVGSVKLSKTAEVNPSLSFKPSTTCAKTRDYPTVSSSRLINNKESRESNFCILYDYDAMKWHQDGDKDHSAETASRISEIMKKLDEDGVLDRIAREPFVMANRRLVLAVHHNLDYLAFVNSLPKSQKELELKFSQFAGISLFSSKGTPQAVFAAAGAVIRVIVLMKLQIYLSVYVGMLTYIVLLFRAVN